MRAGRWRVGSNNHRLVGEIKVPIRGKKIRSFTFNLHKPKDNQTKEQWSNCLKGEIKVSE